MSNAGFSAEGFRAKRLQDIRRELERDFRDAFGSELSVDEASVAGQLIGLLSKREANLWEMAEVLSNARNPSAAEGVYLDRVNEFVAVERLPATNSTVTCVMTGTPETVIPAGAIVERPATGAEFESIEDTELTASRFIDATIVVDTVKDTTYTVEIDDSEASYIASNDNEETILNELRDAVNALDIDVTASVDDDTLVLQSDDTETTFELSVGDDLEITIVGTPGQFSAVEAGIVRAPALSITEIGTDVVGWNSVINYTPASLGRARESDSEFRQRRRDALGAIGGSTDLAITSRIEQVEGVSFARTFSNRTNSEDAEGRPAKSFEVVIEGGANSEIAETIFETQPAGVESFGTTEETVIDSQGFSQTVFFSRPEAVFVWANVTLSLYEEETFPNNGVDLVRDEMVQYADEHYVVAKDVIRQRLKTAIYSVPGIGEVTITLATSIDAETEPDPGDFAEVNIEIGDRQRASLIGDRISISVED